jgi:hypothetical protein
MIPWLGIKMMEKEKQVRRVRTGAYPTTAPSSRHVIFGEMQ